MNFLVWLIVKIKLKLAERKHCLTPDELSHFFKLLNALTRLQLLWRIPSLLFILVAWRFWNFLLQLSETLGVVQFLDNSDFWGLEIIEIIAGFAALFVYKLLMARCSYSLREERKRLFDELSAIMERDFVRHLYYDVLRNPILLSRSIEKYREKMQGHYLKQI